MIEYSFTAACRKLFELARGGALAILVHARPDGDCIGSAYALVHLLKQVGCRSRVVCSDPMPTRLRFIAENAGFDTGITLSETPEIFHPQNVPAIALDIASPAQLGSLEGVYDIKMAFDHHMRSTPISDRYLDPNAAATGEILWRVAKEWKQRGYIESIPSGMAPAIYAAISSDTGCFRYSNVTPLTHRVAAQLLTLVPNHADIDHNLFEMKTPGRLAAEQAAVEMLRLCCDNRIAVCSISTEEINARGFASEDLDALIDVARSVAGVELAFSVRQESKNLFRISARSNTRIDVASLCASFGGGGHTRAAGCTISASDLESATRTMINAAKELLI